MTGAMKASCGAHTVYRLAYHLFWIPRYRRQVLVGDVARRLEELIRELCVSRDWEVKALAIQEDHVHLFACCRPGDDPARVMNVVRSITARELYAEFPRLRRTHWGGKLWADGSYDGSAGGHVTSDLIKRYVEYQERESAGQHRLF